MKSQHEHLIGTAIAALVAAAWPIAARAQDAAPAPTTNQGSQGGASADPASGQGPAETQSAPAADGTLQDIIVTAQQRGENLQKAAIAIDVVKGDDLVAAGVTTVDNLNKLVPALTVEGTGQGNIFFIRGVGNFALQTSAETATAFNYDGIYIGTPLSTEGTFFDLQRIEVLKGPQGTLYGRNATAGAINVLPVQPEFGRLGGYATGSLGNYDTRTIEGAINVPVTDDVAIRLGSTYVHHSGYLKDGTSAEDAFGVRLQLKARITPEVTVRLSGDYSHQGGTGQGQSYVLQYALDPTGQQYVLTPSNVPLSQGEFSPAGQAFIQTVPAGSAGRTFQPYTKLPFENNRFYGAHAQIDWSTPIGTVTVLPAYRGVTKDNFIQPAFALGNTQSSNQYSVEARLVSDKGKLFDYNVGVYYFNEAINHDHQSVSIQSLALFQDADYRTKSYAGYGRLTLHATDRLRLTGGIRYTKDDKSFTSTTNLLAVICVLPTGCPAAPLLPYTTYLGQQPYLPAASGGIVPAGGGAIVARADSAAAATLSKGKVTWRGAVEYDVAPRSLAYASVETGFRSGGFNTAQGFLTFAPETITAYTIGLKNRLLDNKLQLNLEAFDWEYHDQQLTVLGVDITGSPSAYTRNIGQERIRGAEAEIQYLVTPRTIVSADIQYLDAVYRSFAYQSPVAGGLPLSGCAVTTASPTFYNVDCTGKPAFNSPHWTVNGAFQQTFPVGSNDLVLGVSSQLRGPRYTNSDYIAAEHVGTTTQTDAQLAFGPHDGRWSIAAFVHNLENDRFQLYTQTGVAANILVAEIAAPRTYGARLSTKF